MTEPGGPPSGGWAVLAPIALRAFFALSDRWLLSNREQATLIAATPGSIRRWRRDTRRCRLHRDQLERISTLMAIDAVLAELVTGDRTRAEWLRDAHVLPFNQARSPLAHMLRGNMSDLMTLRSLLDYAAPRPAVHAARDAGALTI